MSKKNTKQQQQNKSLVVRETFDCAELMKQFPPKYVNGKKKSVFKEICPQKHKNCSGIMTYSRYKYFFLPKSIKISLIDDYLSTESKKFILTQDIFQYNHDPSKQLTNNIYHYYVNFADKNLFGFYHGGLFAQDELMTLEHPILCSLREKLINLSKNITSDYQPTCAGGACIILNAIRHGGFDDDGLKEIYGRKFGRSSSSRCIELIKRHIPPLKDNIIAIAGIMKMKQKYTQRDITYLLNVIYCGFNAAKLETIYDIKNRKQETSNIVNNESKDNDTELKESDSESKQSNNNNNTDNNLNNDSDSNEYKIIIHTGNFGCGAFGGNIIVHSMLQIIVGLCLDIEIRYHCVDANSHKQVLMGIQEITNLAQKFKDKKGNIKMDKLIKEIVNLGYCWGMPNGT